MINESQPTPPVNPNESASSTPSGEVQTKKVLGEKETDGNAGGAPKQKELSVILDEMEQRANDYRIPKWPWIVDHDPAYECGPHALSGLAMILAPEDDSRLPWPPARLLEWPTAKFIAAARSDVPALCAALRELEEAIDYAAGELQLRLPMATSIDVLDSAIKKAASILSEQTRRAEDSVQKGN